MRCSGGYSWLHKLNYEDIDIKGYATVSDLFNGLTEYFHLYNYERPHQSLDYQTPAEVHFGGSEGLGILLNPHLKLVDSWS